LFTTLGSGGRQTVFGGGTADNTSVDAEGYLLVDPGGTAGAVYIGPGGVQDVYGSDSYSFIGSGGRQYIHGSGVVSASIIGMGGTQHVSSGGTSLHVTIGIDGRQFIYDNGTADSTVVGYGGEQIIEAGGASEFTTVSSGGRQEVCSGGKAHSTIVAAGGCQYVSRGGAAYSTAVAAGGRQEITAGGAADRTVVALGGQQSIYYGGKASHTTVASGGCQHIGVKGTAFAATVNQGGKLDIACGGILAGSTHIADGGILRIAGHAVFQDSATVLRIECNGGASLNEPLTGAGSLVKDGTGTLTFNAANDFIGSLIIDGGTAALGPAGSLKSRSLHLRGNTTFDHSAAAGPFPVRSLAVTGLNATIRPGDSATDLTGADIVCAVPPEARSGDIFLFINGNAVTDASTRFAITYSAGRPAVGAGDYFVLLAAAGTLDTGGFTRQDVRTQCGDTFSVEPDPGDSGRLIAVLSAPA
jgi:autotransporter passenger strand-loop-strand repeat protein/autotransporter-associated beta strand protein